MKELTAENVEAIQNGSDEQECDVCEREIARCNCDEEIRCPRCKEYTTRGGPCCP